LADLIPNTNTHNCEAGRALEEEIRLAQAAESNRKRSARGVSPASRAEQIRSVAREPEVGIVWFLDGRLIIESTPVSCAECYADSLTHPKGHPGYWAELQAAGFVPSDLEYDEVPRGRAGYDTVQDQFFIYRDRCIPTKAIRQIIRTLRLPKAKVVVSLDQHYRCPRCMKEGRNEED